MAELVNLSRIDIDSCTQLYLETYAQPPWEESYDSLSRVPAPDGDFLRIEDICIQHSKQRNGYGTELFQRIKEFVKASGMDSIALNTVRDYPAFSFYKKNGFQFIETSAFLYCTV